MCSPLSTREFQIQRKLAIEYDATQENGVTQCSFFCRDTRRWNKCRKTNLFVCTFSGIFSISWGEKAPDGEIMSPVRWKVEQVVPVCWYRSEDVGNQVPDGIIVHSWERGEGLDISSPGPPTSHLFSLFRLYSFFITFFFQLVLNLCLCVNIFLFGRCLYHFWIWAFTRPHFTFSLPASQPKGPGPDWNRILRHLDEFQPCKYTSVSCISICQTRSINGKTNHRIGSWAKCLKCQFFSQ